MDPNWTHAEISLLIGPKFSMQIVGLFGGAERDRTADLLVANEALSQLSYSPHQDERCTPLSRALRRRTTRLSVSASASWLKLRIC